MTPAAVVAATRGGRTPIGKCGRPKRQGSKDPCGRGAGWGTPHPGYGACKLHGGNTPSGIKFAAKEASRAFAVGMLGAEVDGDPGEAMMEAVRLSRGQTAYYRLSLIGVEDPPQAMVEGLATAVRQQAQIAKMALDAGIDERRMKVIEQESDRIVAAAEAAIAVVKLDAAARTLFAREFASRLAGMGQNVIEGTATEQ